MSKFLHSEAVDIVVKELVKNGFSVILTSSRNDNVDLYATEKSSKQIKIVVRTISPNKYTWIAQNRFDINDPQLFMAVVFNKDSSHHVVYLFPAVEWKKGYPFVNYLYDKEGLKSSPEYGISFSQKTIVKVDFYILNNITNALHK